MSQDGKIISDLRNDLCNNAKNSAFRFIAGFEFLKSILPFGILGTKLFYSSQLNPSLSNAAILLNDCYA